MAAIPDVALQRSIAQLDSKSAEWAALGYAAKVKLLEGMLTRFQVDVDHKCWSEEAAAAFGFATGSLVGETTAAIEELVNIGAIADRLHTFLRTYRHLAEHGSPPTLTSTQLSDGRATTTVFPMDAFDQATRAAQAGLTIDVVSMPNTESLQEVPSSSPGVCLVLGAGNQSFLAFCDALHWLFVEGKVVVLKHHPLRTFCSGVFSTIFSELIDRGYFAATLDYGLGHSSWLTANPLITHVHMTGGVRTHDAIVWGGTPAEQAINKARGTPVLQKPMSSELGCITPWVVCPGGVWSDDDLAHQAGLLAMGFAANNSCNCCAPKVVVLDKDWPQAKAFVAILRQILSNFPMLPQHYPGTNERFEAFRTAYPQREEVFSICAPTGPQYKAPPNLPWMLIELEAGDDTFALQTEAFSPVLAIYSLACGNDAPRFLEEVVPFLNTSVWGTLSMTIIIRDELLSSSPGLVEKAIHGLKYGTVALNTWTATTYSMSCGTWGAYPGEVLSNVASGIGVVGNAYLLRAPEKTIVRAPFRNAEQRIIERDGTTKFSPAQLRAVAMYTLKNSPYRLMQLIWHMIISKPLPRPQLPRASATLATPPYEGTLLSRGNTTGLFAPRYFVLESHELRWYGTSRMMLLISSSRTPSPTSTPIGCVRLEQARVESRGLEANLEITITPAGRRTASLPERTHPIILKAASKMEHLSWLHALQKAAAAAPVESAPKDHQAPRAGQSALAAGAAHPSVAEEAALSEKLSTVAAKKAEWAGLSPAEKARLLGEILEVFASMDHEAWARESLLAQGYERVTPDMLVAVEMIKNTRLVGADLEALADTFATMHETGKPPVVPMRDVGGGVRIADVFPRAPSDFRGPNRDWKVEVWMDVAKGRQMEPPKDPRLGLLLAAGNQGFLGICDLLYMLFIENMATIIKHNPVRSYNHKWVAELFAPLIQRGYVASVVGGIEDSKALLADSHVDHVHMTGGKATHDAIVWGGDKQRVHNKLGKPITSELGGVSPYIIGPGAWNEAELKHHASYFVTVLMDNNSCNCNAPQLLILPPSGFPATQFLGMVKAMLQARPAAPPYYPGTRTRYKAWQEGLDDIATTELLDSSVKLPPGSHGLPLPWAFSTIDYDKLERGEATIVSAVEAFGPLLAITTLPEGCDFWTVAAAFCNEKLMGSLSCTVVMHPSNPSEEAVKALKYGSVGVNSWGGQSFGFNAGTWGAYPGEPLEAVYSGIGVVRNYLLLGGVEKTVVRAPFISEAHIGTSPKPMTLPNAKGLCAIFANDYHTYRHNEGNEYMTGNFLPIEGEGVFSYPAVEGTIPAEMDGCFFRNGVNQRYKPNGRMHMYDGDAMIHVFCFSRGVCTSYANSYVRTPRFIANEAAGRELYSPFGDLTLGTVEAAKKIAYLALKQRLGVVTNIPVIKAQSPATSTLLIGGALYAIMEYNCPFRIRIDPNSGQVSSGQHSDFDGKIPVFSAHSKVDPSGCIHYVAKAPRSMNPQHSRLNTYGVVGPDGSPQTQVQFEAGEGAPPGFLHDYFLTAHYVICIDHSVRADPTKLATTGYFNFDPSHNLRLGVMPRGTTDPTQLEWYDLGTPGFNWHTVCATEDGDLITCWMPLFETYPNDIPIHSANEPESYLHKVVINTATKKVEKMVKFTALGATERCATNDLYTGEHEPRYAYLMMRGKAEMYDGFIKFDLKEEKTIAHVSYGDGRFGGEALFHPRPGATEEDDGWLLDIVYDKVTGGSELCIWDASNLESTEPIAKRSSPQSSFIDSLNSERRDSVTPS